MIHLQQRTTLGPINQISPRIFHLRHLLCLRCRFHRYLRPCLRLLLRCFTKCPTPRMPIRTSKEVPRFQGAASRLEHYIEDIELLCADRQKSGDAELIRWAIYYTNEKSSDTWVATRDALESPKTWEDFQNLFKISTPRLSLTDGIQFQPCAQSLIASRPRELIQKRF